MHFTPFIPLTCADLAPAIIECDKSFTRSDALAKHMRLQHNIEASVLGRGGKRKRSRDREEPSRPAGFSIFKVEPHTQSEMHISSEAEGIPPRMTVTE